MHHVINRVAMTLGLVVTALAGAYSGPVAAEDKYPSRPIEFVVPWGPGGGADQLARLTGKLLEPVVGTSLPVINVPGATGGTGMAKLLSSPVDGYSMAVYIADSHALLAGKDARWKPETSSPSPSCCRGHPSFSCRRTARSRCGPTSRRPRRKSPGH